MDPLHGDDRARKPLFSDSNGVPFSRSQVEAGIKAMIQLVVPASDVKKYSFHSYRIYLCTALDNVGCPPSKIKRILRWLSDEALQTYARDGERMYAKWLHAASGAHISTVQVSNLPDRPELQLLLGHVDGEFTSDYEDADDDAEGL